MLKTRVITAIIMALVAGSILFVGSSLIFQLFVAVLLIFAAWEWSNLSGLQSSLQRCIYTLVTAAVALLTFYIVNKYEHLYKTLLMGACLWWGIALLWVQSYPASALLWRSKWARCLMGFLVLVPSFLAIIFLRNEPAGVWGIAFIVTLIASADIGAYFSGKAFGKTKLAAKVSPGKTWEGVIGGLVLVSALTCLYTFLNDRNDYLIALAVVIPTAMVSVLGDLLESMLKRHRGIKDSSNLLPGHGGILDRIDGFTSAVPVYALAVLSTGWSL